MKKAYLVRQERKFNGDVSQASFTYECEETEIQGVVNMLEGKITVFEENVTLSSAEGKDPTVVSALPIESISMVHSEAKTKYVGAYNKPILFKTNIGVVQIQEAFKLHKPFTGAYETAHPDQVYPKVGSMSNL